MIELKSKKTGRTDFITEEEYNRIKNHPKMHLFIVTQIRSRPIVPTTIPDIKEIKKKTKKE